MFRTATIVALAGFATAQVTGLSSQCTNALAGIISNPDVSSCLGAGSITPLANAISSNSSIVGPFNTWITSVCSAAPCSNDTISSIVKGLASGCQTELGLAGGDSTTFTNTLTDSLEQGYPILRKVFCLKEGNTNCITQTLTNFETAVGPLSLSGLVNLYNTDPELKSIPQQFHCTDCLKGMVNEILNDSDPSLLATVRPAVEKECGASFADGKIPASISQSAVNAASGNNGGGNNGGGNSGDNNGGGDDKNGATGLFASGLVVSGLAISTIVVLL